MVKLKHDAMASCRMRWNYFYYTIQDQKEEGLDEELLRVICKICVT